jgi:hypothetical protein
MMTENYFETELGFQLTASDVNHILIALGDLSIYYKKMVFQILPKMYVRSVKN